MRWPERGSFYTIRTSRGFLARSQVVVQFEFRRGRACPYPSVQRYQQGIRDPSPEGYGPQGEGCPYAQISICTTARPLAQTDDNVGKLRSTLRELGLQDNTIVLYTSDHGEMLGDKGLWQKMTFYEPAAGVPLLFRAPGVTPANSRCAAPVSLVQVAATLLELCGVSAPAGLDGSSFARLLHEPGAENTGAVFVEMRLKTKSPGAMIRQGRFKYCYYVDDLDELFDLDSDPGEMKNLASLPAFRENRDELKQKLFAWHSPESEVAS